MNVEMKRQVHNLRHSRAFKSVFTGNLQLIKRFFCYLNSQEFNKRYILCTFVTQLIKSINNQCNLFSKPFNFLKYLAAGKIIDIMAIGCDILLLKKRRATQKGRTHQYFSCKVFWKIMPKLFSNDKKLGTNGNFKYQQ